MQRVINKLRESAPKFLTSLSNNEYQQIEYKLLEGTSILIDETVVIPDYQDGWTHIENQNGFVAGIEYQVGNIRGSLKEIISYAADQKLNPDRDMTATEHYSIFKSELLKVLSKALPERDIDDFDEHEHPNTKVPFICFTFLCSEEDKVDKFIRSVRDELLTYPEFTDKKDSNKFVYEVWKSHIQSHDYWSVHFWLASKYKLVEDSQP
jgi:hypothetical protein